MILSQIMNGVDIDNYVSLRYVDLHFFLDPLLYIIYGLRLVGVLPFVNYTTQLLL